MWNTVCVTVGVLVGVCEVVFVIETVGDGVNVFVTEGVTP